MARYTKQTVTSLAGINSELTKIQTAIQDTLSRKVDTPNQMESTFDANSNRIINLPEPVSDHEPFRKKDLPIIEATLQPLVNEATAQADRAEQEADTAKQEAIKAAQSAVEASEYSNALLYTVPFDFNAGGTVTARNQLVLWSTANGGDGREYRWAGALPKTVPPSSTPASTGGISDSAWVYTANPSLTQQLIDGTAQIGNVTADQVAEATDIAIGNFVTPEQFFVGDLNDPSADYLAAMNSALATGRRVLLRKIYGLSATLLIPAGARISGVSRQSSGFIKLGVNTGTNSLLEIIGDNAALNDFKVDCNNSGSAPSNRLNAVAVVGSPKLFNIERIDVYNATGYGHVTFGSESNPQIEGVYKDCYAENCQVLFEQIGALGVTLYSCNGLAVSGRTLDIFHPYAGSKRVTYIDCHGYGVSGSGVNITVTNGFPIGPITFINSSIDMNTTDTTAFVTGIASGGAADVEVNIFGGSFKSAAGATVVLQTPGKFKAVGAKFSGVNGFNCAALPRSQAYTSLTDCELVTALDSSTSTAIALVTNGNNPIIKGGTITATNLGVGGAVAVSGTATISRETILTPVAPASEVTFLAESAGVATLQVDSATLGFQILDLPTNATRDKIVATFTLSTLGGTYTPPYGITWNLLSSGSQIQVRVQGIDVTGMFIHYRIGVLP